MESPQFIATETAARSKCQVSDVVVELVEGYGEWFVHTLRSEKTIGLSRFECEKFAVSHAELERARFGIGSAAA